MTIKLSKCDFMRQRDSSVKSYFKLINTQILVTFLEKTPAITTIQTGKAKFETYDSYILKFGQINLNSQIEVRVAIEI